jgi:hypothetical protein
VEIVEYWHVAGSNELPNHEFYGVGYQRYMKLAHLDASGKVPLDANGEFIWDANVNYTSIH